MTVSVGQLPPLLSRETWWLFGLPLLGYFYSFLYQLGYLHFFRLPYWLVQVGFSQVAFVILLLLFVLGYAYMGLRTLPAGPYWGLIAAVGSVVAPSILLWGLMRMAVWYTPLAIFIFTVFGLLCGLWLLLAIVNDLLGPLAKHKGGLLERYQAHLLDDPPRGDLANEVIDKALISGKLVPAHLVVIWVGFMLAPFVAYHAGKHSARREHQWLIAPGRCVVVAPHDGRFICAKLVRDGAAVLPVFELLGPEQLVGMRLVHTGRLRALAPVVPPN